MAKEPVAGRVKTRCTPPCSPDQAASLAAAALAQTLGVVAGMVGIRRVLALDGHPGPWLPDGFDVVAQRGSGLGARLDHAFATVGTPALLIGMDTPQISASLLLAGLAELHVGNRDVLGPATDGGFWTVGLARPFPGLFTRVPMSRADTGERLLAAMERADRRPAQVPELADVDDMATAREVAGAMPASAFAAAVEAIDAELAIRLGAAS
jgi:glycosyltransferase A (GT-A) superfamily protein (DUF2064 family)